MTVTHLWAIDHRPIRTPRYWTLLREHFPEPYLARWDISNGVATSPDIPGVTIPGDPFMGVMGVAPDHALVKTARKREEEIIAAGGLAYPPVSPHSAVPGGMVGKSGLRTGPPRENGGNIDIRQTRVGTRLFFPVLVEGALFSTGDAHFAQGDGEVCGAAIEMNATVRLRFAIHPGQAENQDVHALRFIYNESAERSRNYIATTGISVSASGSSSPEDSTLAAKQALLEMIRYLERRGYTQQQAYALCSVAADLRLSQLVNGPNALVTAVLPLDIFDH